MCGWKLRPATNENLPIKSVQVIKSREGDQLLKQTSIANAITIIHMSHLFELADYTDIT